LLPNLDSDNLHDVESDTLDATDRKIVHVINIDPRASFRTIAEVVGVSDQTAARRYRRLRESAGLHVTGLIRGPRAGWVDWIVRLQTTPGSAGALADALARRRDTRWVRLFAGGTEVVCVLQARTDAQRDALFLRGLPGSRRVVQISAQATLHAFSPVAWSGMMDALSAEQVAMLSVQPAGCEDEGTAGADAAGTDVAGSDVRLEPDDEPLLAELAHDGRATNAALAAAVHWHESTVRRRVAELHAAGLLYFDVDLDDRALGYSVSAMLWLSVEPARLDETGRAMAGHPEIPFVAATSGQSNLIASATFRDTQHLYEYLSVRLSGLPGVRSVETLPAIGTIKRSGLLGA
jgi:DNA-binding Lrp family transcriptional regulator